MSLLSIIDPQIEKGVRQWIREEQEAVLIQFFENYFPKAPENSDQDVTFSIPDLAKYLGCSLGTIHAYKKRKVFPYYQTGRTVYFKKKEVDTALAVKNKKG